MELNLSWKYMIIVCMKYVRWFTSGRSVRSSWSTYVWSWSQLSSRRRNVVRRSGCSMSVLYDVATRTVRVSACLRRCQRLSACLALARRATARSSVTSSTSRAALGAEYEPPSSRCDVDVAVMRPTRPRMTSYSARKFGGGGGGDDDDGEKLVRRQRSTLRWTLLVLAVKARWEVNINNTWLLRPPDDATLTPRRPASTIC